MNRTEINREFIENLLLGAAPERKDELRTFWREYSPAFFIAEDRQRSLAHATSSRVEFTHRSMQIYWLLGHASWKALQCYCPSILLASLSGGSVQAIIDIDLAFGVAEAAFETALRAARELHRAESCEQIEWPQGIRLPHLDTATMDAEQKAIFDITCIATAYVFLHEVRHVKFAQDGDRPDPADEELQCDLYAREFLLARIGAFSKKTPWSYQQVKTKRAMGLALGAFILYEITHPFDHAGTTDYPAIADRMDALIGEIGLDAQNYFWIFAASVLAAALRQHSRRVLLNGVNPKEICENLIAQMRPSG